MAIDLNEQDGQTPLDPDEKAGLTPTHLATKGDLNDWEQENILSAVRWLKRARATDVLSEGFCRELHSLNRSGEVTGSSRAHMLNSDPVRQSSLLFAVATKPRLAWALVKTTAFQYTG